MPRITRGRCCVSRQAIEVSALTPEAPTEIVRTYIAQKSVLIESPDLYISQVVKPTQAIADMLDDSAKERVIESAGSGG